MRNPPKILKHSSGQAFVRLPVTDPKTGRAKRKNHYLGKYGTPEADARGRALIANYVRDGSAPAAASQAGTVGGVLSAYLDWAATYYVKNGKPTRQIDRVKLACKAPGDLFAGLPAAKFGVAQMEAVLREMVKYGWTRGYINTCFSVLKGVWKWAGLREYVTMEQALRVGAVPGLKKGRTSAPEPAKVRPVELSRVLATLPHLGKVPRAMVELQMLTAMRPAEVCLLRREDLDTEVQPWVYQPHRHKNDHRDQDRIIYLGPKARAVLEYWVSVAKLRGGGYLFRPEDALEDAVERHGPRMRKGLQVRRCQVGDHYPTASYTNAIVQACKRAGVEPWFPLQLRHTRATEIRAKYGRDAARGLLGHRELATTDIYAELDEDTQRRIAEQEG